MFYFCCRIYSITKSINKISAVKACKNIWMWNGDMQQYFAKAHNGKQRRWSEVKINIDFLIQGLHL